MSFGLTTELCFLFVDLVVFQKENGYEFYGNVVNVLSGSGFHFIELVKKRSIIRVQSNIITLSNKKEKKLIIKLSRD